MHYELGGYEALLMRSGGGAEETIASEFHTENERIRLAFLELLCSNEPNEILQRHVQTHQKALLRLAGTLENQSAGKPESQRSIKIEALGALFDKLKNDQGDPIEGATDQIIEHLFRLQIHNTSLFNYIEHKTRQDLAKIKDPTEQLFFLEGTFRNVSNMVTLKEPFQPPEPGSLLATYIEWLEKLIQQKEFEIAALLKEDVTGKGKMGKIVTSLSVAELALMIRLFKQTGVFKNSNLSEVARFMVALVETRNSKPGKTGSFNNLYQLLFKVPKYVQPAVREVLHKMLKNLDDIEAGKGMPLLDVSPE